MNARTSNSIESYWMIFKSSITVNRLVNKLTIFVRYWFMCKAQMAHWIGNYIKIIVIVVQSVCHPYPMQVNHQNFIRSHTCADCFIFWSNCVLENTDSPQKAFSEFPAFVFILKQIPASISHNENSRKLWYQICRCVQFHRSRTMTGVVLTESFLAHSTNTYKDYSYSDGFRC